ncbi:DUF3237 domain-containing protein [Sphingobium sp. Leaf26]|uniref:DUF3237 domain-containing protein n=1 Tax=Sphingobium sp. Leaf26 TaxID=1735693 RepID=UPI000B25C3EF|nr:DUF3237 domain-containing protein [Sphingobium sp. Leaf26]
MSPEDTVPADAIRPRLAFVYVASAELAAPIPIGETPDGIRRIIPILSGTVEGPNIRGRILGGGSDWQLLRSDGVTVADATYGIETDDGTIIQIRNRGLRHGPAEVMARLAAGDTVDPSAYYFRTIPEFIAPLGPYAWLNSSIFLCSGARYADSIRLWVWSVT